MNYTHEGHLFFVAPDFEQGEIVLEGPDAAGYDLVIDASDLKEQAESFASYSADGYDTQKARGFFEDEYELENFIDSTINLATKIEH